MALGVIFATPSCSRGNSSSRSVFRFTLYATYSVIFIQSTSRRRLRYRRPSPAISMRNSPHKTAASWTGVADLCARERRRYQTGRSERETGPGTNISFSRGSRVTPRPSPSGVTQACTLYAKEFRYGDSDCAVPGPLVSLIYWPEIGHAKFRRKYAALSSSSSSYCAFRSPSPRRRSRRVL